MKHLYPLLFAILTNSTTGVLASEIAATQAEFILAIKTDPGISIKIKDGIIHRGSYFYKIYSTHHETQELINQIRCVINMPDHMHTTQIQNARTEVIKLQNMMIMKSCNEKLSDNAILSDTDIKNQIEKHLRARSQITDPQELAAYINTWRLKTYTPTNLVQLELERKRPKKQCRSLFCWIKK